MGVCLARLEAVHEFSVNDTAGARSKKDLRDHNKDLTFILIDIEQKSTDGGDLDISIYWDGGSRFAN